MKLKERLHLILESVSNEPVEKAVNGFLMGLIILNIAAALLYSVEPLRAKYSEYFYVFEVFSVAVFSVEYVLRLWVCVLDTRYAKPFSGRLKFALTPLLLVDLASVLPFYLPLLLPFDFLLLRSFRLLRLIRMFKIGRYSRSLKLFGKIVREKRSDLVMSTAIMLVFLILASTFMYLVEREAQPVEFASIFSAMWWAISTFTTVGYAGLSPITLAGKIIGSLMAVLGIGLFALPVGIVAAGFMEEAQKAKKKPVCPHCGKELE
jgi:voltage-gated potassium channel